MSGAARRAGEDVRIYFRKNSRKTLIPRTNIGNSEQLVDEFEHDSRGEGRGGSEGDFTAAPGVPPLSNLDRTSYELIL
jgi:hypothetical protein